MEMNLNIGGNSSSASVLTALQSLKHVTCSTPCLNSPVMPAPTLAEYAFAVTHR
jgi:hypothetical protein